MTKFKVTRLNNFAPVRHACLAFAAAALCLPQAAQAGVDGVHISANGKMGGGYTVRRGNDCYAVTAHHVVKDGFNIVVTDAYGGTASADISDEQKDLDLALLKVESSGSFRCESNWQDGAGVESALSQNENVVAEITLENQNSDRKRLFFAGREGGANYKFKPIGPSDSIRRGESGSPVMNGDHLVGILLATNTSKNTVTVLRQDMIHNVYKNTVLAHSDTMIVVRPIMMNRQEHRQGTLAALDSLSGMGKFIVTEPSTPRDPYGRTEQKLPVGADYVIDGNILQLNYVRKDASTIAKVIDKTPAGDSPLGKLPIDQADMPEEVGQVFGILNGAANEDVGEVINGLGGLFGGKKDKKEQNKSVTAPVKTAAPKYVYAYEVEIEFKITDLNTGRSTTHFVRDDSFTVPYNNGNPRGNLSRALESSVRKHIPTLLKKGGLAI